MDEKKMARRTALLQPAVDLVELLHGVLLLAEGLHHLLILPIISSIRAGLLAPGLGLELEHVVGALGDEAAPPTGTAA